MTQPRHSGATVVVEHDAVEKVQPAAAAAVEYARTRLGQRIADACGDFLVPAILDHDAAGRLVFERFHGLLRLDGTAGAAGVPARAFACAGRALGRIHGGHAATGSDVFSHGDFGLDNVLWSPQRDALVVIDWSDAAWVPRPCVDHLRPAAVDLAIFLVGLYYRSPVRAGRRRWRRRAADDFLAAYRDAGGRIDRNDLHGWVERLTAIKQSGRRTWLGRLLHAGAVLELRHHVRVLA
jgi:hypothetical protein